MWNTACLRALSVSRHGRTCAHPGGLRCQRRVTQSFSNVFERKASLPDYLTRRRPMHRHVETMDERETASGLFVDRLLSTCVVMCRPLRAYHASYEDETTTFGFVSALSFFDVRVLVSCRDRVCCRRNHAGGSRALRRVPARCAGVAALARQPPAGALLSRPCRKRPPARARARVAHVPKMCSPWPALLLRHGFRFASACAFGLAAAYAAMFAFALVSAVVMSVIAFRLGFG